MRTLFVLLVVLPRCSWPRPETTELHCLKEILTVATCGKRGRGDLTIAVSAASAVTGAAYARAAAAATPELGELAEAVGLPVPADAGGGGGMECS